MTRLAVPKTYKLYIGGAFPRSESGRTYEVAQRRRARSSPTPPRPPARTPATRSSPHAAPSAAGRAPPRTTAARCSTGSPSSSRGVARSSSPRSSTPRACPRPWRPRRSTTAIDRWVWYAGWADKYAQVAGNANPVAGPYFNISVPEPTGVVAIVAPQDSSLLGLVSAVAPALVAGQHGRRGRQREAARCRRSAWPRCSRRATCPRASSTCSPARPAEIAPWLASHADVNALDLVGRGRPRLDRPADRRGRHAQAGAPARDGPDAAAPSLGRITAFTETKTVWHTKSLR